ncbi:MAG: hypothetical protein WD512_07505 [Candidatus Paceibacterota bacterium]
MGKKDSSHKSSGSKWGVKQVNRPSSYYNNRFNKTNPPSTGPMDTTEKVIWGGFMLLFLLVILYAIFSSIMNSDFIRKIF